MADKATIDHSAGASPVTHHRSFLASRASRLMYGVAGAALIAAVTAFGVEASAPKPLFSAEASAGARGPATAAAIPGFADLAAPVRPAVVSVRVKAHMVATDTSGSLNANPFEGTPFEKFFRGFGGPGRGLGTARSAPGSNIS